MSYVWYLHDYYVSCLQERVFKQLMVNGAFVTIGHDFWDHLYFEYGEEHKKFFSVYYKEWGNNWAKEVWLKLYSELRKKFKDISLNPKETGFKEFESKAEWWIRYWKSYELCQDIDRKFKAQEEERRIAMLPENYFKRTKNVRFINFEKKECGRLITQFYSEYDEEVNHYQVVYCRNPYGTHNLILVCDGEAIRHGYEAVLGLLLEMYSWGLCPRSTLSKAYKYKSSIVGAEKSPWWKKGFGDEVHNFVL